MVYTVHCCTQEYLLQTETLRDKPQTPGTGPRASSSGRPCQAGLDAGRSSCGDEPAPAHGPRERPLSAPLHNIITPVSYTHLTLPTNREV